MDDHSNDIVVTQYGFDIGGILSTVFDVLLGNGSVQDGAAVTVLWTVWKVYSVLAFSVSAFFLFVFIYSKMRYAELATMREKVHRDAEHKMATLHHATKNRRWEDAVGHIESDNPNDWRLAIIEADIMLEDLLNTLGYAGVTIGDKLKQASPQFFRTLDDAWKAHRTRNDIAHRGTDFILTKRIAQETIAQYRRVFEEFEII